MKLAGIFVILRAAALKGPGRSLPGAALTLDREYFASFGWMRGPRHLWTALVRFIVRFGPTRWISTILFQGQLGHVIISGSFAPTKK